MSALPNASGTASGQDLTGGAPGNAKEFDELAPTIRGPGVNHEVLTQETTKQEPKKEEPAPAEKKPDDTTQAQPTEKDYRHATQKITKEIEKKMALGRKMVEKDSEAIYDIAETDPDLAQKLLQEYDYGTTNLEEFLQKKESGAQTLDDVKGKVISTDSRLKKIEKKLMDERVLRMREINPDLQDELEEQFRELYNDPRFADEDPTKVLNVARALTGQTSQQTSTNDVALQILKSQEGAQTSLKGGGGGARKRTESPQSAAVRRAFGHSEADVEKYLPPNIDEILGIG